MQTMRMNSSFFLCILRSFAAGISAAWVRSRGHRARLLRAVFGCLFFPAVGTHVLSAAEAPVIVRVQPGWRDATSFKRISEYFDGRENTGGITTLRTRPAHRAGYYYLLRVANPGPPQPVTLSLQVITAATADPAIHTFSTELKDGDTMLNLGLTGEDWPDPKANPVAWKLDLIGQDGQVLASEKSYLWEKPAVR